MSAPGKNQHNPGAGNPPAVQQSGMPGMEGPPATYSGSHTGEKIMNSSPHSRVSQSGRPGYGETDSGVPDEEDRGKPSGREAGESFGISCPLCGGSLRAHQGEKSITCGYCDSSLYIQNPPGVKSFMTEPAISPGRAKLNTLHYLRDNTSGRVKARHTSIMEVQLLHVPFWRITGRLVGWVCGDRVKMIEREIPTSNPHSASTIKKVTEERKPYSRLVHKNIHWSTPACTLPYLGLQGISMKTKFLEWEIFSHRFKKNHTFALPMKSASHAISRASRYFSHLATPPKATVHARRFHLFNSEMALYYYPVYFIRYRHGRRVYSVTLDGRDGYVIRGDYPVRKSINSRNIFFLPALAAWMACTWFPLIIISLVSLYIYDLIRGEGSPLPHNWLMGWLRGWLGGEWK